MKSHYIEIPNFKIGTVRTKSAYEKTIGAESPKFDIVILVPETTVDLYLSENLTAFSDYFDCKEMWNRLGDELRDSISHRLSVSAKSLRGENPNLAIQLDDGVADWLDFDNREIALADPEHPQVKAMKLHYQTNRLAESINKEVGLPLEQYKLNGVTERKFLTEQSAAGVKSASDFHFGYKVDMMLRKFAGVSASDVGMNYQDINDKIRELDVWGEHNKIIANCVKHIMDDKDLQASKGRDSESSLTL